MSRHPIRQTEIPTLNTSIGNPGYPGTLKGGGAQNVLLPGEFKQYLNIT